MSAAELYTNDLAGYSRTLNNCYLATPTKKTYEKICEYVDEANKKADDMEFDEPWISKHWTGERAYYTEKNGKRMSIEMPLLLKKKCQSQLKKWQKKLQRC